MAEVPEFQTVPPVDDSLSWRDEFCLHAARASLVFYALGTLVVALAVRGPWQRVVMTSAGVLCCLLVGVVALTGLPKRKWRAWFVLAPAEVMSLSGFAMVGYLSGPSVVLTLTIMLTGLLLGKRAMLALLAFSIAVIALLGWAMTHGIIVAPNPEDVSMTSGLSWFRSVSVMVLAIAPMGTLLVEVVARIERSHTQIRAESLLREQAETARAQAEMLALTNRQLEAIGQLAAGVAHDFNNNLAAIIGSAELMKEELKEQRNCADLLDDILESSHRAAQLTRQLLAYSRKAPMVLAPIDMHQVVESAVSLLRRSIDPRIEVVARLQAERTVVLGDRALLDNSLLNLLVNARDAMPRGGTLTVATSNCHWVNGTAEIPAGLSAGQYLLLEVLDTGEGIAPDSIAKIFQPFFTTKALGKGTGLGLAAVSGTVKALKGTITVESELDCGTAFRILLPVDPAAQATHSVESPQPISGTGKILLVDDDPLVRRAAAATLESLGYRVKVATDGVDALDVYYATKERFDVAILDLRMPRMGGEATFEHLHSLAPAMPIVFWSGYCGDVDVDVLLGKGAFGFIHKPYRIVELSRIVHDAIVSAARQKAESA